MFAIKRYGRSVVLCILLGLWALTTAAPATAPALPLSCPDFPPVLSLQLVAIYTDTRQSVPDAAAEKKNSDLTAGVDQFLRSIEQAIDRPDVHRGDPAADCAFENFKKWAIAGALTVEPKPYNRDGTVKRGEYLIGLNVLALKIKAAGFTLDPTVITWLRTLNHENMDFYEKASNRGNLRIWAGTAAALFALVQPDAQALDFQNRVWREAMTAIHDDGMIDAELARGQRALIYHMFSFSATLMLRDAREALGYRNSPSDTAKVKSLANMIGRTLCDPQMLAGPARAKQEIPGDWGYRVPIGFGADLLDENWSRCGRAHVSLSDPTSGGDTQHAAAILKQWAQATARPVP